MGGSKEIVFVYVFVNVCGVNLWVISQVFSQSETSCLKKEIMVGIIVLCCLSLCSRMEPRLSLVQPFVY